MSTIDDIERELGGESGSDQAESTAQVCEALLHTIPEDTPKERLIPALKPLLEALAFGLSAAEAEMYIRNRIKSELNLKTKDVDSILKYFKELQGPIQTKKEAAKKKAEHAISETPLTEEERQAAEAILKSPTLLHNFLQMVKKLGVVGEEKNILLHGIALTSRLLNRILSIAVKGDSTAGKSFTLSTTLKLFPESAYIEFTDATPQSLYYTPDDYLKHRIIVIFENHGSERADYPIRTLQSEGKLKILVPFKNPDTGQFETQTIEKEGPTGVITTTTASMIHGENDTRTISMFPDQTTEQTVRVYESVDARYLAIRRPKEDDLKPWQHAQLCLESLPVIIPFVRSFRKYFPKNILRTRRDYEHFLTVIETSAVWHQLQRERVEIEGQTYIRATLADAHIAKVIVEEALSRSIHELPKKSIEVIEAARQLVKGLSGEAAKFTVTKLFKSLKWGDRDTVAKWLRPATQKGYITQVAESKGPKGAEYVVEDKDLPGASFLPSVLDLLADNPEESTAGIYDPITGRIGLPDASTDAPTEEEGGIKTPPGPSACFEGASDGIGASVQDPMSQDAPPSKPEMDTQDTSEHLQGEELANATKDMADWFDELPVVEPEPATPTPYSHFHGDDFIPQELQRPLQGCVKIPCKWCGRKEKNELNHQKPIKITHALL